MRELKIHINYKNDELVIARTFDELLKELYQDEKSKNFVISHKDGDILVHGIILDLKTRLFKEFKAAINDGVVIDDGAKIIPYYGQASLDALKIFIRYLYTKKIKIDEKVLRKDEKKQLLLDLWDLANFFMIKNCEYFFEKLDSLSNGKMENWLDEFDALDEFEFDCREDFLCVNNDGDFSVLDYRDRVFDSDEDLSELDSLSYEEFPKFRDKSLQNREKSCGCEIF